MAEVFEVAAGMSEGLRNLSILGGVLGGIEEVADDVKDVSIDTLKFAKNAFIASQDIRARMMPSQTQTSLYPRFGVDKKSTESMDEFYTSMSSSMKRAKLKNTGICPGMKDYAMMREESSNGYIEHPIHEDVLRVIDVNKRKSNPFFQGMEHALPTNTQGLRNMISFSSDESPSSGIQRSLPIAHTLRS